LREFSAGSEFEQPFFFLVGRLVPRNSFNPLILFPPRSAWPLFFCGRFSFGFCETETRSSLQNGLCPPFPGQRLVVLFPHAYSLFCAISFSEGPASSRARLRERFPTRQNFFRVEQPMWEVFLIKNAFVLGFDPFSVSPKSVS